MTGPDLRHHGDADRAPVAAAHGRGPATSRAFAPAPAGILGGDDPPRAAAVPAADLEEIR